MEIGVVRLTRLHTILIEWMRITCGQSTKLIKLRLLIFEIFDRIGNNFSDSAVWRPIDYFQFLFDIYSLRGGVDFGRRTVVLLRWKIWKKLFILHTHGFERRLQSVARKFYAVKRVKIFRLTSHGYLLSLRIYNHLISSFMDLLFFCRCLRRDSVILQGGVINFILVHTIRYISLDCIGWGFLHRANFKFSAVSFIPIGFISLGDLVLDLTFEFGKLLLSW